MFTLQAGGRRLKRKQECPFKTQGYNQTPSPPGMHGFCRQLDDAQQHVGRQRPEAAGTCWLRLPPPASPAPASAAARKQQGAGGGAWAGHRHAPSQQPLESSVSRHRLQRDAELGGRTRAALACFPVPTAAPCGVWPPPPVSLLANLFGGHHASPQPSVCPSTGIRTRQPRSPLKN